MSISRKENARDPVQLERMQELENNGMCFFCSDNYLKVNASASIHNGSFWYIKSNDFPYEGLLHHYLIASRRHVKDLTEITGQEWDELLDHINWLTQHLNAPGASVFVRSGDLHYTGATLEHLHLHFIIGISDENSSEPIKVKLAFREKTNPSN